MRLLLDTHLLRWALAQPSKLPAQARKEIDRADVYVSAASIWEISINSAIGKLRADPAEVLGAIDPSGFRLLPITGEHAVRTGDLPPHHKDPFDRMLVAQASVEPMILLTNDIALADYGPLVMRV